MPSIVGPVPKNPKLPSKVMGFRRGDIAYCWKPDSNDKSVQLQVRLIGVTEGTSFAIVEQVMYRTRESVVTWNRWKPVSISSKPFRLWLSECKRELKDLSAS